MSVERHEVGPRMSQVVIHGNTVYLAGVVARNASGKSITEQTKDILAAKTKEVALERFFCDLAHVPYAASVPIRNGSVQIPDMPGLGPDPDEALMRYKV